MMWRDIQVAMLSTAVFAWALALADEGTQGNIKHRHAINDVMALIINDFEA